MPLKSGIFKHLNNPDDDQNYFINLVCNQPLC